MRPHPGIRIDRIPVEGGGGLILTVGVVTLFLLGVPAFRPVVAAGLLGGLLLAPVLHRFRR
jgi:hypothetical protein